MIQVIRSTADRRKESLSPVAIRSALLAVLVACLFLVLEIKFQKQGEEFFSPVRPVVLRSGASPESDPREGRLASVVSSRGRCGAGSARQLSRRIAAAGARFHPVTPNV